MFNPISVLVSVARTRQERKWPHGHFHQKQCGKLTSKLFMIAEVCFSDCGFKKHHERGTYSVMLLLQRKGSPPLGKSTSNCLSLCLPLRANNFTEASEVPVLPVGILEVHGLLRFSHHCWTSIPIFVLTWSISLKKIKNKKNTCQDPQCNVFVQAFAYVSSPVILKRQYT